MLAKDDLVYKMEPLLDDGEKVAVQVPVKYKHCHGDTDNMRKAVKVQNFLRQHFVDILNVPRKASKLRAMAEKVKSLFKFK